MAIDLRVGMTIRAYDRVTNVVKGITRSVKQLEDAADKANEAWSKAGNIRNAAEGVSRFGQVLRGSLLASTDGFRDFESVMLQVKANADNLSEEGFGQLTDRAKELGATTRFSAKEAADGMLQLSKAGFSTEDVMTGIAPTLNLASAEALDLGRAAEITAGVMTTFGLQAKDLENVGDILSKTASVSTTDVGDLGESFKYAGGQARALGVTLPQTGALFAALAANQIKGSQAGTSLAGVLRGVAGASRMSGRVLASLGVKTKDSSGNLRDLSEIFTDINSKIAKFGSADRERILAKLFGAEAVPGAIALLEQASTGKLREFMTVMENAAGETQRKADIMGTSAEMVDKRFSHAMEGVSLEVGRLTTEVVDPLKEAVTEMLVGVVGWIKENPKLTKTLIGVALAGSALATILSGVLFTATTIYATKGLVALLGGFSGILRIAGAPLVGVFKGLLVPLRALTAMLWAGNTSALAMAGTLGAIGAAVAGVTLAIVELKKHWDELDFMEGLRGMKEVFLDSSEAFGQRGAMPLEGAASVVGQLLDPRALLKDLGLMDSAPSEAVAGASVDVGGTLRIQVDGTAAPTVTQAASNGPLKMSVAGGL